MKSISALRAISPLSIKALALVLIALIVPAISTPAHASETPENPGQEEQALMAASQLDILTPGIASMAVSPIIVTAADLVTKVYGTLDLPESGNGTLSRKETAEKGVKALKVRPEIDETGIWFESTDGYRVNYSGMTPDVSAVAQFDKDSLSSFSYFFIFPYASGCREDANRNQCAFCSSLLQEMYDMNSIAGMAADEGEDPSLFSALGSYDGNSINVTLREQTQPDASGRFLLILEVTPNAGNPYDSVMALSK